MIENPKDLNVIAIALRLAISVTQNPNAKPMYQEILEKVERLQARWAPKPAASGSQGERMGRQGALATLPGAAEIRSPAGGDQETEP